MLLSTSCNCNHWCTWLVLSCLAKKLVEMSGDPTHGMTMAPPRLLSGCGQGERCQHIQYDIGICRVCKLDLILATLSILSTSKYYCLPFAFVSMHCYCFQNVHAFGFCKFCYPLVHYVQCISLIFSYLQFWLTHLAHMKLRHCDMFFFIKTSEVIHKKI